MRGFISQTLQVKKRIQSIDTNSGQCELLGLIKLNLTLAFLGGAFQATPLSLKHSPRPKEKTTTQNGVIQLARRPHYSFCRELPSPAVGTIPHLSAQGGPEYAQLDKDCLMTLGGGSFGGGVVHSGIIGTCQVGSGTGFAMRPFWAHMMRQDGQYLCPWPSWRSRKTILSQRRHWMAFGVRTSPCCPSESCLVRPLLLVSR